MQENEKMVSSNNEDVSVANSSVESKVEVIKACIKKFMANMN